MKKRAFWSAALLVLALAASITFGAGATSAAPKQRQAARVTGTVNVVEAGSEDFSSVDVDEWLALMKKRGLTVNYTDVADAATALRTVIAGQADVFIGSLPTAILGVVNGGANIHIIAANDQASDYIVVAQPGITLQNVSGRTMAIDSPGSAGQIAAEIGLQKLGVDPTSIHYVTIGGSSARLTAMLSGRVDLAPLHYPNALTAEATSKITSLVNVGKEIGPYIQSGLIANDNFAKNTALTQEVVNDFVNAERWAASNEYGYINLGNKLNLSGGLTGAQEAQVWNFYKTNSFFGINGGICYKYVTDMVKLNWQLGSLPKPLPARSTFINDQFVQNYLKAHHQKSTTC